MKTRIRKEQSIHDTVYVPEYYNEGWIFKGWESFMDIMGSSCGLPQKAWIRTSKNTKFEAGTLEYAKDVIDTYLSMISEEEKIKYHHKHKEISFIDYP